MMRVVKVSKSDADGIDRARFTCPGCKTWHIILVTGDGAWGFNGDEDRPTFTPSILVNGDPAYLNPGVPRCHSFVTDGQIQFLGDCTHDLAGKTVPLPAIDGGNPE